MALCLPRRRRATSLATRPSTLSVASITNHSCTTSAGLALKVFMSFLFRGFDQPEGADVLGLFSAVGVSLGWKPLRQYLPLWSAKHALRRGAGKRCEARHYTNLVVAGGMFMHHRG